MSRWTKKSADGAEVAARAKHAECFSALRLPCSTPVAAVPNGPARQGESRRVPGVAHKIEEVSSTS